MNFRKIRKISEISHRAHINQYPHTECMQTTTQYPTTIQNNSESISEILISTEQQKRRMLQLKLGAKGEIVIPKKIREHLGLTRDRPVILEIHEKSIELRSTTTANIAEKWEERARRSKVKVSQWVYGDDLYEEGF